MKQRLLLLSFLFFSVFAFSQGWRAGEKQVVLEIESIEQVGVLTENKLNYDIIDQNSVRAYLVPKELQLIQNSGIAYQIEIDDLNKHTGSLTDEAYHSAQEIIDLADSLVQEFPEICQKVIFGESLGGRELSALKISDNVTVDEAEAEVMFDGGIHGDEILASEIVIRFARDICIAYGTDPEVTELIDNREIWLYLMVNPDGRESVPRSRYNNNGVDLNRDWGYMWDAWGGSTGAYSQVESKALRECMYNNQFVVHTTYHAGTEYISLPWSYRSSQPTDWNHIYQLGGLYSSSSLYPNLTYGQGNTGMYAINGSTKDSNYGVMGSISWSMEISYDKQPPASQIMLYYNRNYPAMLKMVEYAGYGLEGIVTDAVTGDPVTAVVFVEDFMPTFTDPTAGDYHKYVLPGTYSITIVANGYESQTFDNVVVSEMNATQTDFELQPLDGHYVYKFSSSQIPDNNPSDEGNTPAVIGPPDDIHYSIGKNGWCVLDMQYPVIDGPGIDLIVYENDGSPEGYQCFASQSMDGPWTSLGTGSGTSEFDLSDGPLVEAQFIKIVDDGDGGSTVANAGFDLDAIEAMAPVSGVYIALYDYEIDDSMGNDNGRIDAGETVDIIVNLKNNGDISADNTTGTINTSSPYITIDNNTANFGTLNQGQSADGVFTITADESTPAGEPVSINLDVSANAGSYSNSYALSFMVGLIVEDWESGGFDQFEWETGGNNNWTISTQNPYEGTYCVKSGSINNNQATYLSISIDVLANGEIGFFKKVSSENNYDYLKFYIDGNLMDQWAGDVVWSESVFPVNAGQHTFTWEYEKDQSVSGGSDCAWLDYITLPSGAGYALFAGFTADDTEICEAEAVNFTDASTGDIISWEWTFEGGTPETSTYQNPSVAYMNAGTFDVSLTVSNGSDTHTFTAEDYITVLTSPETPEVPEGPVSVTSSPGEISTYSTAGSVNASDYVWMIDPEEAGTISENGMECTVDWTDWWNGEANISVKAINECGESGYSDDLTVYVTWVGIEENKQDVCVVSPNPAKDMVNIILTDRIQHIKRVDILNAKGTTVLTKQNNALKNRNNLTINVRNLEKGLYFIRIKINEDIITQKLVIQ